MLFEEAKRIYNFIRTNYNPAEDDIETIDILWDDLTIAEQQALCVMYDRVNAMIKKEPGKYGKPII